jgi:hypothetical protein
MELEFISKYGETIEVWPICRFLPSVGDTVVLFGDAKKKFVVRKRLFAYHISKVFLKVELEKKDNNSKLYQDTED